MPLDCKVYVGNLPRDASESEIERVFEKYGRLRSVWVARNPSGFAFVEYDDDRDAEDAVRALDGTTICGERARVEISNGRSRPKPWMRGGGSGGSSRRPFNPNDRCYECNQRGHYAYDCPRRSGGRRSRRSYSRSRSRSYDRRSRSRSYDRRSSSYDRKRRSRSYRTRSRSRSRDSYRSRSRSRD